MYLFRNIPFSIFGENTVKVNIAGILVITKSDYAQYYFLTTFIKFDFAVFS